MKVEGERKEVRVLMAKPGLDGHWRGAIVVTMALRNAGMEVIYVGNQTPQAIVEAAIQEDVDVVGLSILSSAHLKLIPEVTRRLHERGAKEIIVLAGGIIPREDVPLLKQAGVDEVFQPGSKLVSIVNYVKHRVIQKRSSSAI